MCNAPQPESLEEAYQSVIRNRIHIATPRTPGCVMFANGRLQRFTESMVTLFEEQYDVQPYDGSVEPRDALEHSGLSMLPSFAVKMALDDPEDSDIEGDFINVTEEMTVVYRGLGYRELPVEDDELDEIVYYSDVFLEVIDLADVEAGLEPTLTLVQLRDLPIKRIGA